MKFKSGSFLVGIIVGIILLCLLFIINRFVALSLHQKVEEKKPAVIHAEIVITPSSTPVPTAKIVATNPPAGFCLNVPVLMYHHIEPLDQAKTEGHGALTVDNGWFDKQMAYLNEKGYTAITADQLAEALKSHHGLPSRSIVVTVDDGYQDIHDFAYPIAQKYHTVLNLMIPTGLLNNPGYMSWEELKSMVGSGLVNAYDHTWSHASLGKASPDKINFEILTSKKQLEENLGKPVDIFTYPYGSEGNTVVNFLVSHGFIAAFSEIPGTLQCDSFIMSLHRTRIGNAPLSSYGL